MTTRLVCRSAPLPTKHPLAWREVKSAEQQTAWWDLLYKTPQWLLELACGHYVMRRARKAPRRVRCDGCVLE